MNPCKRLNIDRQIISFDVNRKLHYKGLNKISKKHLSFQDYLKALYHYKSGSTISDFIKYVRTKTRPYKVRIKVKKTK